MASGATADGYVGGVGGGGSGVAGSGLSLARRSVGLGGGGISGSGISGSGLSTSLAFLRQRLRDVPRSALRSEYFRAGMGFLAAGAAAHIATKLWGALSTTVEEAVSVTAEFSSRDEVYAWLLQWLADQPAFARNATRICVESVYDSEGGSGIGNQQLLNATANANSSSSLTMMTNLPRVLFTPACGWHVIRFEGKRVWVHRERDQSAPDSLSERGYMETLTLKTLGGVSSRQVIARLIAEAAQLALRRDHERIVIFTPVHSSWQRFADRARRRLDSVILPPDIKANVVSDVRSFADGASVEWYRRMGIPYRRGYLFHGCPGSGKTSFIAAIAGELGLNICVVRLGDRDIDDEQLNQLLNAAPPRSILLLEDIDAAGAAVRGNVGGENETLSPSQSPSTSKGGNVTFSGLLNALDGIAAQEGRLVFMTTNQSVALDRALVRPGRIDMTVHFPMPSDEQLRLMVHRFFPQIELERAADEARSKSSKSTASSDVVTVDANAVQAVDKIVRAAAARRVSMAGLQGFLMRFRGKSLFEAAACIAELEDDVSATGATSAVRVSDE